MKMRADMQRWVVLLLLTLFTAAPGCKPSGPQPSSQPATPTPVNLELRDWVRDPAVADGERAAPELRIVSAAPNVTEVCCALGLRDQLVGRTRYCTYPPEVADVPSIGALVDVNVEVLLGLKPDVILVAGTSRALTDRLATLGLRQESMPDTSLEDLFETIERVGSIASRPQTARKLCHALHAELDALTREFANVPPARVLLVVGTLSDPPAPPFVAGPGSFYRDLLHMAGHKNAAADGAKSFVPLSLEYILDTDPDVIIELDADGTSRPNGDIDALAVWAKVGSLQAVRTKRVHVISGPEHFLMGPRIARTHHAICRAIAGGDYE